MSVLTAFQAAAPVIGLQVPSSVYSSTDREHVELAALANEVADRIALSHDWERLKRLVTYTGDGTTTGFAWPSDYSRMPKGQQVRTDDYFGPINHVIDHDEWLDMQVRAFSGRPYLSWTMLGGQMEFYPAPTVGKAIKWYYISKLYVRAPGTTITDSFPYDLPFALADSVEFGTRKVAFTLDTDAFQLDERLLKLGIIWQWKANKGLPYAEDMQNFELMFGQCVMRDAGSRTLSMGRRRGYFDGQTAYPWSISP